MKAGRLKPGEKPDRAILWKKARQTAEGMVVDTGLSDVLKKIVSYSLCVLFFNCFIYQLCAFYAFFLNAHVVFIG